MASIKKTRTRRGTVYKITVSCGQDIYGKQVRKYKTYTVPYGLGEHAGRKEAFRVAAEFEQAVLHGFLENRAVTFEEYAKYYIDLRKREGISANRLKSFRSALDRIPEPFKRLKLASITPKRLNELYMQQSSPGAMKVRWYTEKPELHERLKGLKIVEISNMLGVGLAIAKRLKTGGEERFGKPTVEKVENALSRRGLFEAVISESGYNRHSVEIVHSLVSSVYKRAMQEQIITFNPAPLAIIPRDRNEQEKEQEIMQEEDIKRFIEALEGESLRNRALFTFMLVTGCRRGEVCGLTWDKVNFEKSAVLINASLALNLDNGYELGPTKTRNARVVPLPEYAISLLKKHKAKQAERQWMLGDLWEGGDWVFEGRTGGALRPVSVNTILNNICDRHNIPRLHPHTFRHTAASLLISSGMDVLTVSKILGHAKPSMTLDVYGHAVESAKVEAADRMGETLKNIMNK